MKSVRKIKEMHWNFKQFNEDYISKMRNLEQIRQTKANPLTTKQPNIEYK